MIMYEHESLRPEMLGTGSFHAEPSLKSHQQVQKLEEAMESDNVVIPNAQCSGQESGEISESHGQDSDVDAGSDRTTDEDQNAPGGSGSDSKTGDAMMDYSQSCPPTEGANFLPQTATVQEPRPQTLASLSSTELQLQLRYFHTTKSLEDVDLNGPVKCLVCAREGHLAEACDRLTCAVCGKQNEHFIQHCPQRKKCQRCREIGHGSSSCHHKLAAARSEITCDWCQRIGHVEEECELLWRTSGRPWESEFAIRTSGLGCYECGGAGHLGNDCPTRRPGKPMGTSTWSSAGRYQASSGSQGGMMIKGRAKQQESGDLDYGDDDSVNFIRPKISGPTPRGQINIASQGLGKPQSGSWTHIRASRRGGYWNDGPAEDYRRNRDNYRPSNRRSVSPHYAIRGSSGGIDNYKPPLPSGPPPRTAKNRAATYRPMPSAAHNAWSKHRT